MTDAIVRAEPAALEFTPEQRQMIRDTYAGGASDAEFAVFMEVAKTRKLNPLLRQIHLVPRWDNEKNRKVFAIQTGIDGFRCTAERTGKYDGQDEPEFEYDDKGALLSCTVRVYRKDWRRSSVAKAYYAEYVQKNKDGQPNRMWATMPHGQLAKCAEALALRKAFPEDLSGLYTPEEMGQADNPQSGDTKVKTWIVGADDDPAHTYRPAGEAEAAIALIEAAQTREELLAARPYTTPAEYEEFAPDDRRRINKTYKAKERTIAKLAAMAQPDPLGGDL